MGMDNKGVGRVSGASRLLVVKASSTRRFGLEHTSCYKPTTLKRLNVRTTKTAYLKCKSQGPWETLTQLEAGEPRNLPFEKA